MAEEGAGGGGDQVAATGKKIHVLPLKNPPDSIKEWSLLPRLREMRIHGKQKPGYENQRNLSDHLGNGPLIFVILVSICHGHGSDVHFTQPRD